MNATTKTAHTPGPWTTEGADITNGYPEQGARVFIAEKVFSEHDATLIAAAPAMYEALVETMKVLRSLRDNKEEWYTLVTPELLTAWDKNKAALAQAEGTNR